MNRIPVTSAALSVLLFLLTLAVSIRGQGLVRQIRTGRGPAIGSAPGLHAGGQDLDAVSVSLGSRAIFTATRVDFGTELYSTDGTAGGTIRLGNKFARGRESATFRELTAIGSRAFFACRTERNGFELGMTDGTLAGTHYVDINPGPESSNPTDFVFFRGLCWFIADDGRNGPEVWMSAGTPATTRLFIPLASGDDEVLALATNGSRLFISIAGLKTAKLLVSNGSPLDRHQILAAAPLEMQSLGSRVYFAVTQAGGHEPWVSDGTTAGTFRLKDIEPGLGSSFPRRFTANPSSGLVYFTAQTRSLGRELYRTNGTSAGTFLVRDLTSGSASSAFDHFVSAGTNFFFSVQSTLYRTRGSNASTVVVSNSRARYTPVSTGSRVLFANGSKLMTSTGGAATLVRTFTETPVPLASIGAGRIALGANDGIAGQELWTSDGTSGRTSFVKDLESRDEGSRPANLTSFAGRLFFTADDGVTGNELWSSLGTAATTTLFRDASRGSASSDPEQLTAVGSRLYYTLFNGFSLWATRYTSTGFVTSRVAGSNTFPGFERLRSFRGRLYYIENQRLWRTLGTPASTVQVMQFGGRVLDLVAAGSKIYAFVAASATHVDLFVSSGLSTPTRIRRFSVADLVFRAQGGLETTTFGTRLAIGGAKSVYLSDGSSVVELKPSTRPVTVRRLTTVGSKLLFTAGDSSHGEELWVSNGTTAGTSVLLDIEPGAVGSQPRSLVKARDQVFFSAFSSRFGRELWATDGTAKGTRLVRDLTALSALTVDSEMAQVTSDRRVVFAGHNSALLSSVDLLMSDGTSKGTAEITVRNAASSAQPRNFVRVGTKVYFTAYRFTGRELFGMPVSGLCGVVVEPFGEGCPGTANEIPAIGFEELPVLGWNKFAVTASNARPASPAVVFLCQPGPSIPLGSTCKFYGTPIVSLPVATDAKGKSRLPIPIPDDKGLIGYHANFQTAILDPNGLALGGLALTDALRVVLGYGF